MARIAQIVGGVVVGLVLLSAPVVYALNCVTQADCEGDALCDICAPDPGSPGGSFICTVVAPSCDDGNPCTDDVCGSPGGGFVCSNTPNSAPCSDGNVCTDPDVCAGGGCVPGPPLDCGDGNPCTDDFCTPPTVGCEHTNNTDLCDDGSRCTFDDVCADGKCTGTPELRTCHFQCYETKPTRTTFGLVNLEDQFGTITGVTVQRHERLCAPADKNDEDPTAPLEPVHFMGYKIRGPFLPVLNQLVVDQFGSLRLDIKKTDRLFVPALKDFQSPPPAPVNPDIDHYNCYRVKRTRDTAKFVPRTVTVDDQFGTGAIITLKRPFRFCAPVNKNGEDPTAVDQPVHLLCYKTGRTFFPTITPFTTDQFGTLSPTMIKRTEFCVPAVKDPSILPTTTTSTSTSSTTSTSSSTSTTTSTTSSTTTTTLETLCCEVPTGSPTLPTLCFDAISPDVDVKCQLLGGILVPGVCDPVSERCVPPQPVAPNDWCCQCPVPAPPFPHPQFCFEGVVGHESKCDPNQGCILIPGLSCGPHSEACGGSPSGAFVDPADATF